MTRVVIQRGPTSSSSSQNRGSTSSSTPQLLTPQIILKEEKQEREERVVQDPCALADLLECSGSHNDAENSKNDEFLTESTRNVRNDIAFDEFVDKEKACKDDVIDSGVMTKELSENVGSVVGPSQIVVSISYPPAPPPPPVPPPKPLATNFGLRRAVFSDSNAVRIGSSRRSVAWPVVSTRASPSGLQPSSPGTYGEAEGYNSADEQSPCFGGVTHHDVEKERQFELDIRRTKGLEIRRMVEDGNCLFRAVADQVYGDTEVYDLARQMCIDYMERERNHFSQFLTEGFTSYCKRKRRDKVYGNNMEIQALSEMYNRPIHIYSYSTEPINIFHGSYDTDSPPIRLSYHHGRHYNSLVDPRRSAIGAGLGFSSLHGINVDKDQVKAAIKTQQDQQIDSALLAEGRFYSDMELTEKEIERMVMEASRTEYLAEDKFEHQIGYREYSTSGAEPSSSGARTVSSMTELESERGRTLLPDTAVLSSSSMQMALSMGFSYLQAFEAYSMFGDNVDSIVCYLLELGSGDAGPENLNRRKGKAAE